MDIKVTKLPKAKVKLVITEEAKNIKKYFDEVYEKMAPTVEIKGFRAGKAPRLITIETIGRARYNSEVLNTVLPQVYASAVKSEKLTPVASPKITISEFAEDKPFRFEAEVDLLPEIKLGDYKKIHVTYKAEKIEASKEDVEKVVNRLLHQGAKYSITSEPAKPGDKMEISFIGKVKNAIVEQYTSKNYPFILGEKVLLPEFEKHLIGTKKNDNKKFSLEIKNPKTKEKDKVDFDVTINDVWQVELPKVDDEFATKFGHKNPEELKKAISKSIEGEKKQRDRQILEEKVLDEVLKHIEVEISESLVEQEIDRRIDVIKKQTGPSFDQYLTSIKKTLMDLRKDIKPAAERGVRISLALNEIAKDMGYFDPKKLTDDMHKNHHLQQEAIQKTLDELIKIAIK